MRNLDGDNSDTGAVEKFGCVKLIRGATGADTEDILNEKGGASKDKGQF